LGARLNILLKRAGGWCEPVRREAILAQELFVELYSVVYTQYTLGNSGAGR